MPSSLMGSARLRPSGPATSASYCRRWHGCLGSIWLGGTVEARQAQRGSGVVLVSAGGGRRCTFLLSQDLMSDWTWSTLWHTLGGLSRPRHRHVPCWEKAMGRRIQ